MMIMTEKLKLTCKLVSDARAREKAWQARLHLDVMAGELPMSVIRNLRQGY